MPLEKPALPLPRRPWSDFGPLYFSNAIVAFLFSSTGPLAIVLSVGSRGGLPEADIASWIFAAFLINALITIVFSVLYRQPLVFLWSIPGTVLVGPALTHMTFPEVIGAFLATGLLMLVLGLTGFVRRAMEMVPMPIVMAMVAGVFLRFGVDLIFAFRDGFLIAAPMTAAFVLLSIVPVVARLLPPLIGALIAGAAAVWWLGNFNAPAGAIFSFAEPKLFVPQFSWAAMVELVVPLAITVLVVQNGQGIGVLTANGHRPPTNAIAFGCGVGSILTGLFGAVSTCLTGPVNAILSGSGDKPRQYSSAIFFGLVSIAFGLMAPFFTRLLLATPPAFIATLAGLAMLPILQTAFQASFREKFSFGALVCFLVTVADVPIFLIGAPFWGLVFGVAASWLRERADFGPSGTLRQTAADSQEPTAR
ncbi:benzoate/H(+) symporter BenE family transporter [Pseudorhodoplanes sp.]|uniref:benzoate/H(+) symporter BenE family transporter n=1 Tax=Pseudorhodoplanes sp. TaxID=1934341 RepID=UPI003D0D6B9F